MSEYIAFDIGGTMIKYGILSDSKILMSGETETRAAEGGHAIVQRVCAIVEQTKKTYRDIAGVCISTAGVVDPAEGRILYANGNIPGYTGLEIKWLIEQNCGIPCEVENDVMCAGLSEQRIGAASGCRNVFVMTIGTGVGGCVILDGKLHHGVTNSAGEIGYLRVEGEQLETAASAAQLVRSVNAKKPEKNGALNGRDIFELAKNGDTVCQKEIEALCERICGGIAAVCCVLNPEVIVLGGGIMAQKEYLGEILDAKMRAAELPDILKKSRIAFAENGNRAGMLGAYYNFLDKHGDDQE